MNGVWRPSRRSTRTSRSSGPPAVGRRDEVAAAEAQARPTRPTSCPPNNGWQSLGTLVQGGLVLNLDNYANAYGWKKGSRPRSSREHEFSGDGKQMGTGSVFGTPVARASLIEVYYNRALLSGSALRVPKTFADFEGDLAKAKTAGDHPAVDGQPGAGRRHRAAVLRDGRARPAEHHLRLIYSQNQTKLAQSPASRRRSPRSRTGRRRGTSPRTSPPSPVRTPRRRSSTARRCSASTTPARCR